MSEPVRSPGYADLNDFFDPDFHIPIRGKIYTVTAPSAREGLRLMALVSDPDPTVMLTDQDEIGEYAKLLGATWVPNMVERPAHDPATGLPIMDSEGQPVQVEVDRGEWVGGVWTQMMDDGVDWESLCHAGRTAFTRYSLGATLAEIHWQTGLAGTGNPLPAEPEPMNRQAKRAAAKKAGSKTRSTAATTRTRTPRSTAKATTAAAPGSKPVASEPGTATAAT